MLYTLNIYSLKNVDFPDDLSLLKDTHCSSSHYDTPTGEGGNVQKSRCCGRVKQTPSPFALSTVSVVRSCDGTWNELGIGREIKIQILNKTFTYMNFSLHSLHRSLTQIILDTILRIRKPLQVLWIIYKHLSGWVSSVDSCLYCCSCFRMPYLLSIPKGNCGILEHSLIQK